MPVESQASENVDPSSSTAAIVLEPPVTLPGAAGPSDSVRVDFDGAKPPSSSNSAKLWRFLRQEGRVRGAAIGICLLTLVAVALTVVVHLLGWPPPPGVFIGALGFLAAYLAIYPPNDPVGETPGIESAVGDKWSSRFVRLVRGLMVAASLALVASEIWSISVDRKTLDAKEDQQLELARNEVSAAVTQMDTTYSQTMMGHDSLDSFTVLLKEESLRDELDATHSLVRRRALLLAMEMMRSKASDEIGQPFEKSQILAGLFEKYRLATNRVYSAHFESRFDKTVAELKPILLRNQIPISPYINALMTWTGDEWSGNSDESDHLVTLVDLLPDN